MHRTISPTSIRWQFNRRNAPKESNMATVTKGKKGKSKGKSKGRKNRKGERLNDNGNVIFKSNARNDWSMRNMATLYCAAGLLADGVKTVKDTKTGKTYNLRKDSDLEALCLLRPDNSGGNKPLPVAPPIHAAVKVLSKINRQNQEE